ncbi:lipase family protein [Photobacterium atrarenae]|uniref:Lipase family protein n=1 Tax=Photobacterium atrarenae TaxID=865757 RepID=A0ABY5GEH5_9GAMM|nr:lipase family protein [Photobacterium atrarenae]UTV27572.1 lipase family protein [Photobacterium atrarenae]
MRKIMPSLTPRLASEIANIPYGLYQGAGRLAFKGHFEKFFSFNDNSSFEGKTGGISIIENMPILRKVIPGAQRNSEAFAVLGIGKGKYQGDLVISIRGTQNANDWVTNANLGYKGAPNGSLAHAGFINSFHSIRPQIRSYLLKLKRLPNKVHCVGHSLGGALASLCADWLKSEFSLRVNLYTFGSPRVGLEPYARKSGSGADKIYRCTHGADPVPMVPLWPFVHAPHQGQEYRLDNDTGFKISAHKMASTASPGYLNTAKSDSWGDLKLKANHFLGKPVRLKFEHRNQATFTEYWADKISAALITLLKDTGLLVAVSLQATISVGMTFYDYLAKHMERVSKASRMREIQVKGLLGHMLSFIGKPIQKIEDLSAKFIRSVFSMVLTKLYRSAQMALEAIRT